MKYISLTLMILAILTGISAIGQTTMQPFTTDLSCDFYEMEYVYLDQTFKTSASAAIISLSLALVTATLISS